MVLYNILPLETLTFQGVHMTEKVLKKILFFKGLKCVHEYWKILEFYWYRSDNALDFQGSRTLDNTIFAPTIMPKQ